MSDSFDAYHVWLGIPPYDQPPNHYRLLGLEAFEENEDAIANSADRQMAHVRSASMGEHEEQGKQLLQEIGAARAVLLNKARKSAYDTQLKAHFRQYDLAGDIPLSDVVDDLAEEDVRGRVELLNNAQNELWNEKQERAQQEVSYIYAVGGIIVIVVAIAIAIPIVWNLTSSEPAKTAASLDDLDGQGRSTVEVKAGAGSSNATDQAGPASATPFTGVGSTPGLTVGKPENPDGSPATAKDKPSTTGNKPGTTDAADNRSPSRVVPGLPPGSVAQPSTGFNPGAGLGATPGLSQGAQRSEGGVGGSTSPSGGEPAKADPEAAARRDEFLRQAQARRGGFVPPVAKPTGPPQKAKTKSPVPSAAEYATADEEVRSVYKNEIEKAKTTADRAKLAAYLYGQVKTVEDEPISKYVLLKVAQDFAIRSGQVRIAFQCLKQIAISYEIEQTEERRALVIRLADRKNMPNDQRKLLVSEALTSYKELKLDKRYADAHEVAKSARSQALASKDAALRVQAQRVFAEANSMSRMKEDHDEALKVLSEMPEDADAHRNVGLYLCLIEDNWAEGLPHLAKAKSALLADAAKLDMTSPQTGNEMAKVGDAWKAASELKGNELFSDRAMHWYTKAAPLLQGLPRSALDRKMREIRDAGD